MSERTRSYLIMKKKKFQTYINKSDSKNNKSSSHNQTTQARFT